MRVLVGGCVVYGVAAQNVDVPRQLFNVAPAPGLRGRTALQPRMVPAVGPAIDPALYIGQQEVTGGVWSPEQFGIPVQYDAAPPQSSMIDAATGFFGVMAGAAVGYAAATFSRRSRTSMPVMQSNNANFSPTGAGPSLMPREGDLDSNLTGKKQLTDALQEADTELRKAREEAEARARKWELKREALEMKKRLMLEMPEETPVGTVDEYMYKGGVKEQLEQLDYDLIGLVPVKERVREIASLLVVDKMRMKLGMETGVPSLHMCFTGSPGTGKTTVAVRMGAILQRMGYCRTGHVVVATRDDLVGQYVGHTAPKTKEMVKKAMGGILLVDEAYYLYNAENDRDYGQESIEILLNVMENNKEDLVVILAGYKDKMDSFFSYTPGMQSRVGNIIDFPNYEVDELVSIAEVMARELEYNIAPDAMPILRAYCERRMQMAFFSNARTVRNAVDRARMNAAIRIFTEKMQPTSNGMVDENELMNLTAADFQQLLDDALNAADDAIVA